MRNKGEKVIIYFEFSHGGPGSADKGRLRHHLLPFVLLQGARRLVLCWWHRGAVNASEGVGESHPAGLRCPHDPDYLLNIGVPTEEVREGELKRRARLTDLEGALSKARIKKKQKRY